MGLMSGTDGQYKILTDIQGPEDHYGDMDFKIAGTKEGITAIQLDVKVTGITEQIFKETLEAAKKARFSIIEDIITKTLSEPRELLSQWAPKISTIQINPEKIGLLIGPGGKTINRISDEYGVQIDIEETGQRDQALDLFGRMYAPVIGRGVVSDYIRRTGLEAMAGADILATAPGKYNSTVEYGNSPIGGYLKDMVQVHNAGFGTRVLFTTAPYNIFDTHANQAVGHSNLLRDISTNIDCFMTDLREQQISDNVMLFFYSEFGRRAMDNGSGTDHGSGGVAFALGEHVKGGIYGEYPSL